MRYLNKLATVKEIILWAFASAKQPWQRGNLFSRPLLTDRRPFVTGRRVTLGAKPTVPAGSDRRGPSHQATPAERGSWAGTSPADPTQPMGVRCVRGRSRSTTRVICVIRYKSSCVTFKLGDPGFELRPQACRHAPGAVQRQRPCVHPMGLDERSDRYADRLRPRDPVVAAIRETVVRLDRRDIGSLRLVDDADRAPGIEALRIDPDRLFKTFKCRSNILSCRDLRYTHLQP
jgi:hypothetical protein